MVKEKQPNLVFLMETKLRKNKMKRIRIKLKFRNMFVIESMEKSGGLALFWEDECDAEIQNYSQRHINAIIHTTVDIWSGSSLVSMDIPTLRSVERRGIY
jgi:hypothetical protein